VRPLRTALRRARPLQRRRRRRRQRPARLRAGARLGRSWWQI